LDVGCGGGYLAEAFARDGFIVAGVDPAANSIEAARKHASETGLNVDYRVGRSETLPFSDGCFDAVACCDVLEHVDDLDKSVSEVGRVLRPGGVFFYETVNRTWLSKLVLIKICVNPTRMYGRNSSNRENLISSWDAIPLSIRTGRVFHRRTETRSRRSGHFAQSQEVGSAAKTYQTNLPSARRPA
jgi:ubiquinone biosynthesis O-methyltransferase